VTRRGCTRPPTTFVALWATSFAAACKRHVATQPSAPPPLGGRYPQLFFALRRRARGEGRVVLALWSTVVWCLLWSLQRRVRAAPPCSSFFSF
jgi:hypothetical protein